MNYERRPEFDHLIDKLPALIQLYLRKIPFSSSVGLLPLCLARGGKVRKSPSPWVVAINYVAMLREGLIKLGFALPVDVVALIGSFIPWSELIVDCIYTAQDRRSYFRQRRDGQLFGPFLESNSITILAYGLNGRMPQALELSLDLRKEGAFALPGFDARLTDRPVAIHWFIYPRLPTTISQLTNLFREIYALERDVESNPPGDNVWRGDSQSRAMKLALWHCVFPAIDDYGLNHERLGSKAGVFIYYDLRIRGLEMLAIHGEVLRYLYVIRCFCFYRRDALEVFDFPSL